MMHKMLVETLDVLVIVAIMHIPITKIIHTTQRVHGAFVVKMLK